MTLAVSGADDDNKVIERKVRIRVELKYERRTLLEATNGLGQVFGRRE